MEKPCSTVNQGLSKSQRSAIAQQLCAGYSFHKMAMMAAEGVAIESQVAGRGATLLDEVMLEASLSKNMGSVNDTPAGSRSVRLRCDQFFRRIDACAGNHTEVRSILTLQHCPHKRPSNAPDLAD